MMTMIDFAVFKIIVSLLIGRGSSIYNLSCTISLLIAVYHNVSKIRCSHICVLNSLSCITYIYYIFIDGNDSNCFYLYFVVLLCRLFLFFFFLLLLLLL